MPIQRENERIWNAKAYAAGEGLKEDFSFRNIFPSEWKQTAEIERICFPPNEACSAPMMRKRVETAPELFLVAEDRKTGRIAGFLNGLSTDEESLRDEFFMNADLYCPDGGNIMILGLDVLPGYRGRGLARELMRRYCLREQQKGRKKLIITCLKEKVPMYRKMGYTDLGLSVSAWGGEQWHEMVCRLM